MEDDLSLARLNTILQTMDKLRVGVVGDFRLVGYWFSGPSDEPGHVSVSVEREEYFLAGAANVAQNLAALGLARVRSFTVIGEDWRASLLLNSLSEAGVETSDILRDPGWVTPFAAQALLEFQEALHEVSHLEFFSTAELSLGVQEQLLARIEAALPEMDALVVADGQAVSIITPAVLEGLNELAAGAGRTIFTVDSRQRTGQFNNMVRVVTHQQAARWLFPKRDWRTVGLQDFAEAALYPQVDCGCPLFITLGEQGCLVLESGEIHLAALPAAVPLDQIETGETFLAVLTVALAAGATSLEAARLGQLAASVAARKPEDRKSASPEEIVEAYGGERNAR